MVWLQLVVLSGWPASGKIRENNGILKSHFRSGKTNIFGENQGKSVHVFNSFCLKLKPNSKKRLIRFSPNQPLWTDWLTEGHPSVHISYAVVCPRHFCITVIGYTLQMCIVEVGQNVEIKWYKLKGNRDIFTALCPWHFCVNPLPQSFETLLSVNKKCVYIRCTTSLFQFYRSKLVDKTAVWA